MNPDGAFAHQPGAQASGPVAPSVSTATRGATLLRTRVGRILRMGRRPLAAAAPLRDTPRSREPTAGACEAGADSRGAQDGSGPARGALPAGPMTLSGLVPTLERSGGATAATARVSRLVAVVCVAAPGYSAGMRFLFVPFSVLGGALAGALGRWLFSAVWAPWTTRSRRVRAPPGLLVEGPAGLGRSRRDLRRRTSRGRSRLATGVLNLTGSWPGEREPDPK